MTLPLIAVINGKAIYSDKPVREVTPTGVIFRDGSYAEVNGNSCSSVNNGDGDLQVRNARPGEVPTWRPTDAPTDDTDPVITTERVHVAAGPVMLDRTVADFVFTVEPGARNVSYTITGPRSVVEQVQVRTVDGQLSFSGGAESRQVNRTVSRTSSQRGVLGKVLDLIAGEPEVKATVVPTVNITVPGGTMLQLEQVRGDVRSSGGILGFVSGTVGDGNVNLDTTGRLVLRVAGNGDVQINTVHVGGELSVSGDGDVEIGELRGDLRLDVVGDGNVTIDDMEGNLHMETSCNVDVTIGSLQGDARITNHGDGDVTIKDGYMPNLTATVRGDGDLTVGGTAREAHLELSSCGDIRVAHVIHPPTKFKHRGSDGKIKVARIG